MGHGVAVVVLALAVAGCASAGTTLQPTTGSDQGQVLYRISEEQAFTVAIEAYAQLYPKQSLDDIVEGRLRGYNADERSWVDWWSHRLLIVPAVGRRPDGTEVRGYWYDYSGSGTLFPTEKRRTGLLSLIRERLVAGGSAVTVTSIREGTYETDGKAYLGMKRDARDVRSTQQQPKAHRSTEERLRDLKSLLDKGLITDDEYQVKRRSILEGL